MADYLDELIDDEMYAGSRIAATTVDENPADAARAMRLAKITNMPAPVVYGNLDAVDSQTKSQMAAELVRSSPELQKLVRDDYMAARLSNDDYGNLANFSAGARDSVKMYSDLIGGLPAWRAAKGAVEGAAEGFGGQKFGKWATDTEFGDRHPYSAAAWALLGAPIETIFRGMGAVGGAVAGGVREGAKSLGADENTAESLAREAMGIMESLGGSPGAFHAGISQRGVRDFTIKREATRMMDNMDAAERAKPWVDAGMEPPKGLHPIIDKAKAELNQTMLEPILRDVDNAQTSLLRERSPETFKKFADEHYGDQQISISAYVALELYKDRIPEAGDGILGWVPGITESLERARALGEDINVPLADLVTYADPAIAKLLKDDLRAWPGGITAREAAEAAANKGVESKSEYQLVKVDPAEIGIKDSVGPDDLVFSIDKNSDHSGVLIVSIDGDKARIKDIYSLDGGPNSIGTPAIRELLNQFREQHPEIKIITGERISGARFNGGRVKEGLGIEADVKLLNAVDEVNTIAGNDSVIEKVAKAGGDEAARAAESVAGQPVDPAVRSVFDAISNEVLGIDKKVMGKLRDLIEKRNAEDYAAALKRAEALHKKALTPEWRRNLDAIREETEAAIKAEPAVAADIFLSTGEAAGEKFRQRFTLSSEMLTEEQKAVLPKEYIGKNGLDPNDVATLFGFADKDALVAGLAEFQTVKAGRSAKETIAKLTTERAKAEMERRYGNLNDTVMDAAIEQALSETNLNIIAEEMYAGAMKAGREAIDRTTARLYAEEMFDAMKVGDVDSVRLLERTGKHAMDATKELVVGKAEEAMVSLQKRYLTALITRLARAMEEARRDLDKTAKPYQQRLTKNVAPEFVAQVQKLLADAGYKIKLDEAQIERGIDFHGTGSIDNFVQNINSLGYELEVPAFIAEGQVKSIKQMTTAEFADFKNLIDGLNHVGREINKIEVLGEKKDWAEQKADIIATMKEAPLRDKDSQGNWLYKIDATLTRPEEIIKDLDQRRELGPLWSAVVPQIESGKALEYKMMTELANHFRETRGSFTKEWRKSLSESIKQDVIIDPYYDNGKRPYDMTRENLLHIMLNWGNRSNIEKYTAGAFFAKFDRRPNAAELRAFEGQIKALIDKHATKADWEFVSAMWEPYKKWQPMMDNVARNTTGIPPKLIKPEMVTTPHGNFEGGYWPVRYDRLSSNVDATIGASQGGAESLMGSKYFRAATSKSHLKSRTGYVDFVDISGSLESAVGRMQQTIHDIAFREALIQSGKIFYDKDIRGTMKRYYGAEYESQMIPWLKRIAEQYSVDESSMTVWNGMLRRARLNLVSHTLPFNFNVLLSPAPGKLTGDFIRRKGYFADTTANHAFVLKHSDELKHMIYNMDRDYAEAMQRITVNENMDSIAKKAAQAGYKFGSYFEEQMRFSTFYDEFNAAKKRGLSDKEAALVADSQVRHWHGTAHVADQSAMFHGGEAMKMLTIFQGFFNTIYNQQRRLPDMARRGEYKSMMETMASVYLAGAALNILLFNNSKEGDSWGKVIAKGLGSIPFSTVPGLNFAANYVTDGFMPRMPVASMLQAIGDMTSDIKKKLEGKPVKKPITHTANVIGLTTGLPLAQIARTSQFVADLITGKQYVSRRSPENIIEYMRGIKTGEAKMRR